MNGANADVGQLLSALEAEWLDPLSATEEEIEAWLGRRQEILNQLQSVDATSWEAATKETVQQRFDAVQTRDQSLIAQLQERMQLIADQLGNAVQGRAAVRGYRAPEDPEAKIFNRPA